MNYENDRSDSPINSVRDGIVITKVAKPRDFTSFLSFFHHSSWYPPLIVISQQEQLDLSISDHIQLASLLIHIFNGDYQEYAHFDHLLFVVLEDKPFFSMFSMLLQIGNNQKGRQLPFILIDGDDILTVHVEKGRYCPLANLSLSFVPPPSQFYSIL